MKNKILFGVIAVIIVVVGFLLVSKKKSSQTAPQITEQTSPVAKPTITQAETTQTKTQMQEATVIIAGLGFEPVTINIQAGEKVVWINKSGELAAVNSDLHPTHLIYPQLNISSIPNGKAVFLVFDKQGTYKYHNHLNPSQTGTVVVE